jgi:putative thioredoxin
MAIDSTDASFEDDVLVRSDTVPVLVDLWAPWCGPCKSLSPIIERVVEATGGAVELVKVNIDENPLIAQSFQVQSIPAVFAIRNRQIVDRFIGALGESAVREFVNRLLPTPSEAENLVAAGDEASLRRALEIEPDLPAAVVGLAEILVGRGEAEEALGLLAKIPDVGEARRVAALARLAVAGTSVAANANGAGRGAELETHLDALLERVKSDDEARQEFVDLLETMDPSDPRRDQYRRALASRLF